MKKVFAISLLVLLVIVSCKKDPAIKKPVIDYSKFVTIKQGVWGSCNYLSGGGMPGPGVIITIDTTPIKRTIYVFKPASGSDTLQAVHIPLAGGLPIYSQIKTTLVAKTESNDIGFYQVSLPSGQYSVLIFEEGNYWSVTEGAGLLTPVTIDSNLTRRLDLAIDGIFD